MGLQFQSCDSLLKVADLKNLRVTFQEPQDRLGFQLFRLRIARLG